MLGSLLRAATKVAILPIAAAADVATALEDMVKGTPAKRTLKTIGSIADDLDDVL